MKTRQDSTLALKYNLTDGAPTLTITLPHLAAGAYFPRVRGASLCVFGELL